LYRHCPATSVIYPLSLHDALPIYVEMTGFGRDFVADDRREIILHAHAPRRFRVVGQDIVVRGDGQFDPFAGQREHALLNRRITVMTVSERMDVRVTGDHAGCGHFAADPHRQRVRPAWWQGELLSAHAVLETARGINGVVAGGQLDARRPATW